MKTPVKKPVTITAKFDAPKAYQWDAPSDVLAVWAETPVYAESSDKSVIDINEMIGEGFWNGGFTEKKLAALLRTAGKTTDITVNINSPGGDVFQGINIYGRLKQHEGKVAVNIMGLAASAASFIAMAGDEINMSTGSLLMIHNAWGFTVGNRHDMRDTADMLDKIDASMANIYVKRTGMDHGNVTDMMDGNVDGTYMTVAEALEKGFIDNELDSDDNSATSRSELPDDIKSKREIEAALAAKGVSRKDRAQHLKNLVAESDTGDPIVRDADDSELMSGLLSGILKMKQST